MGRKDDPPPDSADELLLYDDTPYIEGIYADGTPFRAMAPKPTDTNPARQSPLWATVADLRAALKRMQSIFMVGKESNSYRFFSPHKDIAEFWNAARLIAGSIPGVPPMPKMPSPFPGRSNEPQEGLHAIDVLLKWCDDADANKAEAESAIGGAAGRSVEPADPETTDPADAISVIEKAYEAIRPLRDLDSLLDTNNAGEQQDAVGTLVTSLKTLLDVCKARPDHFPIPAGMRDKFMAEASNWLAMAQGIGNWRTMLYRSCAQCCGG